MGSLYQKIAQLGNRYGADKIMLHGSRVRGDYRERSDIDLAVFGMPFAAHSDFLDELDNLPTLLDFDKAFITDNTPIEFLDNIERDGVVLMYKYESFVKAVAGLKESIAEYAGNPSSTVRDGVIQRFEFCAELAWKSAWEYLQAEGYDNVNSPKATMRVAFADGLIDDESGWLTLIDSRNKTSHIYDESVPDDVYQQISSCYLRLFVDLADKLK